MFFLIVKSCISFRLSARMSALATGLFHVKFDIGHFFKNPFRKYNFLLSDKNIGKFTWRSTCAYTSTCFEHPNVHPQYVTLGSAMNSLRKALLCMTQYLDTADSDTSYCTSPQHIEGHCFLSSATRVTIKRRNIDDIRKLPFLLCEMPTGRHRRRTNHGQ
jgi:hypothetical protein